MDSAFKGCSNLAVLIIGNSVKCIYDAAFKDCVSLTSVTVPNSVDLIGDAAFEGCSNLMTVNLGNALYDIGSKVFANCRKLETVTCLSGADPYAKDMETPFAELDMFENSEVSKATLRVPASLLEAYKTTAPWSEFGKIEAIDVANGIANINSDKKKKDGKYFENGKIVIVKNGKKFNINGLKK